MAKYLPALQETWVQSLAKSNSQNSPWEWCTFPPPTVGRSCNTRDIRWGARVATASGLQQNHPQTNSVLVELTNRAQRPASKGTSPQITLPSAQNFPTTSAFSLFFPSFPTPFSLYLEYAKPLHTSFILVFTKFSFTFSVKLPSTSLYHRL